jgi:hypothetical protein
VDALPWAVPALAAAFLGIALLAIGITSALTAAYASLAPLGSPGAIRDHAVAQLMKNDVHDVSAITIVGLLGGAVTIGAVLLAITSGRLAGRRQAVFAGSACVLLVLACGVGFWGVIQVISTA